MTISDFIEELKQKEIEVSYSAGKLKYSGPEEHITPELIEKLKKNKGKLIKYFLPKEGTNIMPLNTEGNKPPLFLIHGDAANYILSDYLGPDQPVYGFFHPGSNGEAICFKSVKKMAKAYLDQVFTINPVGPYYLGGFSFGGILAFEMAIQLQKSGHEVPFLALIDCISPFAHEPIKWHSNLFKIIRSNILGPVKRKVIRFVKLSICKSFTIMKKPIPIRWRKFNMWEKYKKLFSKYKVEKFNGNILLFKAGENLSSYNYLGWETLVNEINMFVIDGKHTDIFENKKSVDILKTEFKKHLDDVKKAKE